MMAFFKYKPVKSLPTLQDGYHDAEQEVERLGNEAQSLVNEFQEKQLRHGIAIEDFRIVACNVSSFAERDAIEKWFAGWKNRRNRNIEAHSQALRVWAGLKDELERREREAALCHRF